MDLFFSERNINWLQHRWQITKAIILGQEHFELIFLPFLAYCLVDKTRWTRMPQSVKILTKTDPLFVSGCYSSGQTDKGFQVNGRSLSESE